MSEGHRPSVAVIIPHFNDLAGLEICLTALQAQTYPAERVQIIIGDNASPQGLEAVEAVTAGRAKVVLVTERGAGPARNGAVAQSRGEILAFIDSDCVAEPEWIEEGVRALSDYDFVGGRVKVLVDDEDHMTPVEAWERVFAFDFKTYIERKKFTGAGNLLCPRSLFETAGGFLNGISEDTEWSKRAQACGFSLGYAPRAIVGHPARRTWDELIRKWRRINTESYGLSAGQPGRRLRWIVKSLLLPASAVAHTPKVLIDRGLHKFSQRIDALGVLYAIRLWRVKDYWAVLGRDIQQVREGRPGVEFPGRGRGEAAVTLHVAVCIVTYRNPADITVCLAALSRQTYADFEVVICENGGPEAFEALRAVAPQTLPSGQPLRLILAAGNLGYAGGVNACLSAAPAADAWWVLNPDTEPSPDAIEGLLARLEEGGCDLIGGTVLMPDGRVDSRALRWWPWLARSAAIDHGVAGDAPFDRDAVERDAAYVCGGCMFVTRRFMDVVGPMREDYFLYCEELEWCLRARQRGLRIGYAPDAKVIHFKGTTTGIVPDWRQRPRGPVFLDERNKILVTRDIFPGRLPIAAASALIVLVLRFGKRRAWKQLGWAVSGWLAGLANQRGTPAWMR